MSTPVKPSHFLEHILREDIESGKHQKIVTRFPPEPNGHLHIGHAKSICLNFGLAASFGGDCHLRFDDTNPEKESQEYIDAITEDVRWLGYEWAGDIRFASSYFQQFYDWALLLINEGLAYVCELSADQAREYRGTLTTPGVDSPQRSRSVEENLTEFEKMRAGELEEGAAVLRAKIDMAHGNINMRDPILYRIRKQSHHQTGDTWCIYPSYDFAHGQEDAIEGVTHSICTLEFQDHKPLYDWFIEHLPVPNKPKQYEFARLFLNYTVTSKRKLKMLVDENRVDGWDDPRLPTLSGYRRRGYTAAAIRQFCEMVGVTRANSTVDVGMLEYAIRDDLNENAPRAMCVLDPVEVVLKNFADYHDSPSVDLTVPVHPNKEELGERTLPFTETIYIDRADFSEDTTLSRKKFKRLVLGEYVRLRGAYVIKAVDVERDADGVISKISAELVPNTIGETPPEGIRPRGVIHWVSATDHVDCEIRLYDRLFLTENPGEGELSDHINPQSLTVLKGCKAEVGLRDAVPEVAHQFEREGYFCLDNKANKADGLVFNRTIGLKDNWQKKV